MGVSFEFWCYNGWGRDMECLIGGGMDGVDGMDWDVIDGMGWMRGWAGWDREA